MCKRREVCRTELWQVLVLTVNIVRERMKGIVLTINRVMKTSRKKNYVNNVDRTQ